MGKKLAKKIIKINIIKRVYYFDWEIYKARSNQIYFEPID